MTSKVSIRVKIRDIERLEKTAEKCFEVAKAHPGAACKERIAQRLRNRKKIL